MLPANASVVEAARLFAALNVAIFDASVVSARPASPPWRGSLALPAAAAAGAAPAAHGVRASPPALPAPDPPLRPPPPASAPQVGWEAKYTDLFWRPVTAIRQGDGSGQDAELADPQWAPELSTPPHPEYPSGAPPQGWPPGCLLETRTLGGGLLACQPAMHLRAGTGLGPAAAQPSHQSPALTPPCTPRPLLSPRQATLSPPARLPAC